MHHEMHARLWGDVGCAVPLARGHSDNLLSDHREESRVKPVKDADTILLLREELALLDESDKAYHDDPDLEPLADDFRRKRRFELLIQIAELEERSSNAQEQDGTPSLPTPRSAQS